MLKNIVTLVTGGTGCLGYGVASRFARKGAPVILSDLPSSNGAQIAKELGENVTFIPADVRSEKDVQQLVYEIQQKYKKLNVIANCAGTSCKQPFYNFTENRPIRFEDYQDAIQTNVIGTYNVCRIAAGLMFQPESESREGSELELNSGIKNIIINTAGIDQQSSGEQQLGAVINGVTTNAIIGMTKHLAKDLTMHGIRVVSVLPSGFKSTENNQTSEGYRFAHPDEFGFIVQSLVFNGYVNCDSIELDGGQKLRTV